MSGKKKIKSTIHTADGKKHINVPRLIHTHVGEIARVWREVARESHVRGFDGDSHRDGTQQRRSGARSEELRKLLTAHRKATHAARFRPAAHRPRDTTTRGQHNTGVNTSNSSLQHFSDQS